MERLYVAPDGGLHLLAFGLLRDATGRRLLETLDLRLIQSGRDLLRPAPDQARRGLMAMGGIDYDQAPAPAAVQFSCPSSPARQLAHLAEPARADGAGDGSRIDYARSQAAAALREGFKRLPHSEGEVKAIAGQYCATHPDEPVEVHTGAAASKARLGSLSQPPRVLHLATHGFYRKPTEPADRPMLLAGVALAGANATLRDAGGQDGILYALEALDLNLDGTELVVLSACETAQGQIDYGEGVSGLVRALRTAGARAVLVTLRPVGDQAAAQFMQRFYGHWLGDARGDSAAALRQTQTDYLAEREASPASDPTSETVVPGQQRGDDPLGPSRQTADPTWSSFILIGR